MNKITEIKKEDILVAKLIKAGDWPENLTFYSNDQDFLQVATWNYNEGKHLKAHAHKICERSTNRTNEFIFIKSGSIKSYFYDESDILFHTEILNAGDMIIIYAGGHSYDILTNNTQVVEVKNGPYPGIEKDKKVIEL